MNSKQSLLQVLKFSAWGPRNLHSRTAMLVHLFCCEGGENDGNIATRWWNKRYDTQYHYFSIIITTPRPPVCPENCFMCHKRNPGHGDKWRKYLWNCTPNSSININGKTNRVHNSCYEKAIKSLEFFCMEKRERHKKPASSQPIFTETISQVMQDKTRSGRSIPTCTTPSHLDVSMKNSCFQR